MFWQTVLTVLLVSEVHSKFTPSVSQDAMDRCHRGLRDGRPRCEEYANLDKREVRESKRKHGRRIRSVGTGPDCDNYMGTDYYDTCNACQAGSTTGEECKLPEHDHLIDYPTIDKTLCLDIEWGTGRENNVDNNYGNCMNMTTDATYRYITSNSVPDFYLNPYCPIGLGFPYCIQQEIDTDTCFFTDLICGADNNGPGSTPYGDVWVAQEESYKIRLEGNPTQQDRPGDMYDSRRVGGAKTIGDATAVAINGIAIKGPNIAGDVSIDDAGFQLTCGGHVTPPMGNKDTQGNVPFGPPKYHFHKSPECLSPFTDASKGVSVGGEPYKHAKLMGWALDGFGVYAYQEEGGGTPIVDECGGHFGPVDTGEVVYHYHSRAIVPYHLACQGPALGRCNDTQSGTNYCHPGCGYEVCVQPGTEEKKLNTYLARWNDTWLDSYQVNPYNVLTRVPTPHHGAI